MTFDLEINLNISARYPLEVRFLWYLIILPASWLKRILPVHNSQRPTTLSYTVKWFFHGHKGPKTLRFWFMIVVRETLPALHELLPLQICHSTMHMQPHHPMGEKGFRRNVKQSSTKWDCSDNITLKNRQIDKKAIRQRWTWTFFFFFFYHSSHSTKRMVENWLNFIMRNREHLIWGLQRGSKAYSSYLVVNNCIPIYGLKTWNKV